MAKIAGFFSDNPLTRSWAQTMDRHVITPIEARMMGRDRLMPPEGNWRSPIAALIADRMPENGVLTPEILQAMSKLKGSPVDASVLEQGIRLSPESPRVALEAIIAGTNRETWKPDVGQMSAAARVVANGREGLSRTGNMVRQYGLGSPVAAYSAVTAGGALATQAGIDAYDWLMAQQQQAVKESQLPLSEEDQAME